MLCYLDLESNPDDWPKKQHRHQLRGINHVTRKNQRIIRK